MKIKAGCFFIIFVVTLFLFQNLCAEDDNINKKEVDVKVKERDLYPKDLTRHELITINMYQKKLGEKDVKREADGIMDTKEYYISGNLIKVEHDFYPPHKPDGRPEKTEIYSNGKLIEKRIVFDWRFHKIIQVKKYFDKYILKVDIRDNKIRKYSFSLAGEEEKRDNTSIFSVQDTNSDGIFDRLHLYGSDPVSNRQEIDNDGDLEPDIRIYTQHIWKKLRKKQYKKGETTSIVKMWRDGGGKDKEKCDGIIDETSIHTHKWREKSEIKKLKPEQIFQLLEKPSE